MKPLRILVVDDQPMNLEVARAILETAGHHVEVAANGREAVERCTAIPSAFDLVVMDIAMPVMDGIEATRQIRAHSETSRLPILFLTGSSLNKETDAALAAGGDVLLQKPIRRTEFLDAIERVISQQTGTNK